MNDRPSESTGPDHGADRTGSARVDTARVDTARRLDAAGRLRRDVLAEAEAMRGAPGEDRVRAVLEERAARAPASVRAAPIDLRARNRSWIVISAGVLAAAAAIVGIVWLGGLLSDPGTGAGSGSGSGSGGAPGLGVPGSGGGELRLGADGIALDPATDVERDASGITRVRWRSEIPATAGRVFRIVFRDAAGLELERVDELDRPEYVLDAGARKGLAGAASIEVTIHTPSGERIGGSGVVPLRD